MARLLLKAVDAIHPDSVIDKRASYKAGDVVAVVPDTHVWGKKEGLPDFIQVDMPGVDPKTLKHLLENEEGLARAPTAVVMQETIRRRRFKVDITTLTITRGKANAVALDVVDRRK